MTSPSPRPGSDAVIVSAARTAVGRAVRGTLAGVRSDELGSHVLSAALERAPGADPDAIDDVIIGCAFPEAEQGLDVGRVVALRAGLPESVPAMTVNRFCASGLQAIAQAADRIRVGEAGAVLAGGLESMSMVPMTGNTFRPNPTLAATAPGVYLGMGITAENVAERFGVSREEQDAWALISHQRAVAAIDAGHFVDEIAPYPVGDKLFSVDEGPRRETSLEALAGLRPAFRPRGTVTAGNSSQTSDGAAAVLLTSTDRAAEWGLRPRARFVSFAVSGVAPEIMGIGPVEAIPRALALAGIGLDEVDLFEINEAFASQLVYVARTLGIPDDKLNVNGGAIALGHPLGATGARLATSLIAELERRAATWGVVSMCIGGGMGAAGVFQRL